MRNLERYIERHTDTETQTATWKENQDSGQQSE